MIFICILIVYHFSIPRWSRFVVPFSLEDNGPIVLLNQYHGWRCNHGIELGLLEYTSFNTKWLSGSCWINYDIYFYPWKQFLPAKYMQNTLLAKKVVTPPLKTIKPMWIELLCFHLAEIGMIWTRDYSPTKSDITLGRHSMQGQVGSSSSETTV